MRIRGALAVVVMAGGCAPPPVWTEASVALELTSSGYWVGSTRYQKARVDLTAAQLTALAGLEEQRGPLGSGADQVTYRLLITELDERVRTYVAAEADAVELLPGTGAPAHPVITIASLRPFLETFSCLRSREIAPKWPRALSTDPGCFHLSELPGCQGTFRFELRSPRRVELHLSASGQALRARMTALDGGLLEDSGEPRGEGELVLGSTLGAGVYGVEVEALCGSSSSPMLTLRFAP